MRHILTLSILATISASIGSCSSEPTSQPILPGFEALQNTEEAAIEQNATPSTPKSPPTAETTELTESQIMAECDRQILTWAQAMQRARNEDNQQVVSIAANAIGLFVTRYRDEIENQAISGAPRFQGIASASLGFSGDESVLPILLNNLGSSDPVVCSKSLLGLAILSSPSTPIAPIATAYINHKDDTEVIANAAFCLFQISFTDIDDADGSMSTLLLDLLQNSEESVRSQALFSLGLIGANQCLGNITNSLAGDPSPDVRVAAAWSLGKIGAKNSTSALITALGDPDALTAGAARAALTKIHGRDLGPDPESWHGTASQN